ncbi:hypothetical protein GCM10028807_60290 [Spirosoma daeguense]
MKAKTVFEGSPEELKSMLEEVIEPLVDRIRELEVQANTHKHAYKISEVAEKIGYSKRLVLEFIHVGRKDKKNRMIRLKHRKISMNDFRVLPADLDDFLAYF